MPTVYGEEGAKPSFIPMAVNDGPRVGRTWPAYLQQLEILRRIGKFDFEGVPAIHQASITSLITGNSPATQGDPRNMRDMAEDLMDFMSDKEGSLSQE